jgi:superfamily II DNA/RNA helicase
MENYLHRVGRTARADGPDLVINFVNEPDKFLVENLDNFKARG